MATFIHILSVLTVSLLLSVTAAAQPESTADDRATRLKQQDVATLTPDNNVYSLPWDTIMERDILWKKRVWRDVDVTKEINAAFAPGAQNLANILLGGALKGKLVVYDGKDGRFIRKAEAAELNALTGISAVAKYQVKEDWLYVESRKKLVVRIVGIAPVAKATNADGTVSEQALFWIFYPDAREYLAQFKANTNANWDQLLQSRDFGSKITSVVESRMPR